MIKVIQTNLSIGNEGVIRDHQALTYDVENWERFVEGVKNGHYDVSNSTMPVPRNKLKPTAIINCDDYHMTVSYENQKSLFYAVGQMRKPKYLYE